MNTAPDQPLPAAPTPAVHLYHIAYSAQTLADLEPGYLLLDNLANERPDWFEYWPIRRFLLQALEDGRLDEQAWYGFFSPKFRAKTGLSHSQVCDFVHRHAVQADVCLFSPQPDMGAFFLNVFEQGEAFDPGLIDAAQRFLAHAGWPCALGTLVMDSRQTVFSNYFVARPAFWREWLGLCEQLFSVCEGPDTPLRAALVQATTYPGQAQRKVFLLERLASLLLTLRPQWRTGAADPFGFAWSVSRLRERPEDAFISDALKLAFREQRFPEYMRAFALIRERFFDASPKT
ncbi:hypothetical protein [Azohydromonas australica]|uniref:hypothetical protein n=1 Tax=Azohydromonas australica TaxID=364039 RepID=UPI000418B92A|nr:hypothetical protein [Azohydromonas australica]